MIFFRNSITVREACVLLVDLAIFHLPSERAQSSVVSLG
jgi:hypothetical protein